MLLYCLYFSGGKKKININKKGEGIAFSWILALVCLLVMGLIYIIFNQSLQQYIKPTLDDVRNNYVGLNSSQIAEIDTEETKYIYFWSMLPLIIFIIIITWLILNAVKKSKDEGYG